MNKNINFNNPIITLGSPFGIGYEIFLLTIKKNILKKYHPMVCIGSKKIINFFLKILNLKISYIFVNSNEIDKLIKIKINKNKFILINIDNAINIDNLKIENINSITPKLDGLVALKCIEIGANLVKDGFFKSIVTLPVSKKNINLKDKSFKGHTEYFQKKWNEKNVYMTFISKNINIFLLTTHIPLNQVTKNITQKIIKNGIENAIKLKNRLGINKKICFLGLNPHAGENGIIGKKDLMIKKIIEKFGKNQITGPIPSDTAFIKDNITKFGLYISCYHDQGLIPFKMLAFNDGVNLSFGMKYIRSSVDHGTAPLLIGKKKANLTSFINAYKLAIKLSVVPRK